MKNLFFLFFPFCCLFIKPILAQTTWADYKGITLTLVKYGGFINGQEVNVFTPSLANHNEGEYILLKSDGTLIWGNSGNGTESCRYRLSEDYCYFSRSSTGQSWIRILKKTGNMLFTIDNLNTYRYFQANTANESDSGKNNITSYILNIGQISINGVDSKQSAMLEFCISNDYSMKISCDGKSYVFTGLIYCGLTNSVYTVSDGKHTRINIAPNYELIAIYSKDMKIENKPHFLSMTRKSNWDAFIDRLKDFYECFDQ